MDLTEGVSPGAGYPSLFVASSLAFVASALALMGVRAATVSVPAVSMK
jgi:hypothetical protein